jgi:hypothetical protein
MNRSSDHRTTVRWSRRALVVVFFAIFWLVPAVVVVVAGAVAGDCSFTPECTDTEAAGLLVAVIIVLFWALVAAPLTLIFGLARLLSTSGHRRRSGSHAGATPLPAESGEEPVAYVGAGPMPVVIPGAGHEQAELVMVKAQLGAPNGGVPEEHLRGLAAVLWFVVVVGVVVATDDEWGIAVAGFAAIVAIPLTVILAASWVLRRLGRSVR